MPRKLICMYVFKLQLLIFIIIYNNLFVFSYILNQSDTDRYYDIQSVNFNNLQRLCELYLTSTLFLLKSFILNYL